MKAKLFLQAVIVCCALLTALPAHCGEVTVTNLAELAQAASRNDQTVTMKPGVYRLVDYIPLSALPERRKRNEFQFLTFSGTNNTFQLAGVTIEVDTALRKALHPPIHADEFLISGNSNTLKGLTITNTGDGTSLGDAVLGISGTDNTLRDCTIYVRGSFPYGYGDLFGKGGGNVINPQKKSGVHILGNGTRLYGCKLYMHSFGHGYYLQKDASDVHFEDCSVEGMMRSTDEMLAETTGPAFAVGFKMVFKNRQEQNHIAPGYMKSLSEDGFRTYGQHKNLTFKNCITKNMRTGFALRNKMAVQLDNCTAIGNEVGFWISSDAKVTNCQGDAQYGPLLFAEGDNASIQLELLPTESKMTVHALAAIHGKDNQITIKSSAQGNRTQPVPILIGYGAPTMGQGMAPILTADCRNLTFNNETSMPLSVSPKASGGKIISHGPVSENKGKNVAIQAMTGIQR